MPMRGVSTIALPGLPPGKLIKYRNKMTINNINPIAHRMDETLWSFGHSEYNRNKIQSAGSALNSLEIVNTVVSFSYKIIKVYSISMI